jgi:ribosomal protein S18 acetylase RimI-like enzyme
MVNDIQIEELSLIGDNGGELEQLLVEVVAQGASIGFLPPVGQTVAARYWAQVPGPDVVLYTAKLNNRIVGTVQLHLCGKQNGLHRAEIAKLMTHPDYRRQGIGRLLMQRAEEGAVAEGRTLLVLDTREGDPSNRLYASIGYIQAGRIPGYARSANGELHATIFYYKCLFKS